MKRYLCVVMLVAQLALLSACKPLETPDPVHVSGENVGKLRTETAQRRDINYEAIIAATMTPKKITRLSFQGVNGSLKETWISPLEWVKEGATLMELDPAELRNEIAVMEQKKRVLELQSQSQELARKRGELNVSASELEVTRLQNIYNANGTSESKYALDRALIQLDIAKNALAESGLDKRVFDIDYQAFLVKYEDLQKGIDNVTLKAPADGIVLTLENIGLGERVIAGRYVMTFCPSGQMLLSSNSNEAAHLSGQMDVVARIHGQNYRMRTYAPVPGDAVWDESRKSNFMVYLEFIDTPPELIPYTLNAVSFSVKKEDVLSVRRRCIRNVNGVSTVSVLQDDKLIDTPVTCGVTDGVYIEILSGLEAGDVIISE